MNKKNSDCRIFNLRMGVQQMRPNCNAERTIADITTHVHFNNFGFPGPDIKPKQPGVVRICLLGGSTTVGLGISEEYFPQKILEREFSRALHKKVELINLSVEGFSSTQHTLLFKRFENEFQPDIVLAYTASGYKVFKDAILFEYTQSKDNRLIRLKTIYEVFPNWLFKIIRSNEFSFAVSRTVIENIRYLKLGKKIANAEEAQKISLLADPSVKYFQQMNSLAQHGGSKFFAVLDKLDIVNVYPARVYDVEVLDQMFSRFSPEILIKNEEFRKYMQGKIPSLFLDANFSDEDYFKGTIYFNKQGVEKFAKSLADSLSGALKANEI